MGEKAKPKSIKELGKRLERMRSEVEPPPSRPAVGPPQSGVGMAFALSSHLVAGLLVGGGIGYLLDRWLGTAPWMLVLFFFLGAAAGMLNVYRVATGKGLAAGYRPAPGGARETGGESREETGGGSGPHRAKGEQGGTTGGD